MIESYLRDEHYTRKPTPPKSLAEYITLNKACVEKTFFIRDLKKLPITYNELLGVTDVRFFGLLQKDDLDKLLQEVNLKNTNVWGIISMLIENGATLKKGGSTEEDDPIATLMLYEITKMKLLKNE